jgi:hypothetical protein
VLCACPSAAGARPCARRTPDQADSPPSSSIVSAIASQRATEALSHWPTVGRPDRKQTVAPLRARSTNLHLGRWGIARERRRNAPARVPNGHLIRSRPIRRSTRLQATNCVNHARLAIGRCLITICACPRSHQCFDQ